MKHDHTDRPGEAGAPKWETDPTIARALARVTGTDVVPADVEAALTVSRVRRASAPESQAKHRATTGEPVRRVGDGNGRQEREVSIGRFGMAVTAGRRGFVRWAVASVAVVAALATWVARPDAHRYSEITRTYTTNKGQSASLLLNDGTHVDLGPGTTFRLVRFGAGARTVVLDAGEAHFKVARSSGAPFTVRSGAVATRVLGTTFFVRREVLGNRTHVAVAEGKVSVDNLLTPDGVTLAAGANADIEDSTLHVGSLEGFPLDGVQEDGEVVFRDTPIPTILAALTKWYGYQFRCADTSLTQHKVTVGMSIRSSSAALSKLEQILNANTTVAGDTVTLVAKHARRRVAPVRTRTYEVWTPSKEVGR